ncbi:cytochrome P450 [Irpex lacteus]|nr:cytochrome P450 [Irpex lacteus]
MASKTVGLLAAFLCFGAVGLLKRRRRSLRALPSPPSDPIIGHLRYMPDIDTRDTVFYEWAQKYGDVFVLHVLGKPIVVINSEKAAIEIMEKRSATYGDRPPIPMLERCGWKDGLIIARYGQNWTAQRKMVQQPLAKATIPEYGGIQEEAVNLLLHGLSEQPQNYYRLLRRYNASVLLDVIYGHRISSFEDEYYKLAESIDVLHPSVNPTLMDASPYFAYLPSWFPGAWFVNYIKETRPIVLHMMNMPMRRVWEEMIAGKIAQPSFTSERLEAASVDGKISARDWWEIEMTSSQLFVGQCGLGLANDASFQTLQWFIAAMLLNPDVQAKAQNEIDEVVGRDRLPTFADRDALLYVQCVMQEVLRHHIILPLGLPHRSMSEDIYEGMRIPKGATILVNARSITWDENLFHEPRTFKPERFLPKPAGVGETFPVNSVFGWGRRICPGRHLADANAWLAIARILSVFTITAANDQTGNPIKPNIEWSTGMVRYPKPFAFDLLPRDDRAVQLIKSSSLCD